MAGTVSGASSPATAALFLAVACDKRTERGIGKSDRTQFAKLKISHNGTRVE